MHNWSKTKEISYTENEPYIQDVLVSFDDNKISAYTF